MILALVKFDLAYLQFCKLPSMRKITIFIVFNAFYHHSTKNKSLLVSSSKSHDSGVIIIIFTWGNYAEPSVIVNKLNTISGSCNCWEDSSDFGQLRSLKKICMGRIFPVGGRGLIVYCNHQVHSWWIRYHNYY